MSEQDQQKYKYRFKTTVYSLLLVCVLVGAIVLVALTNSEQGQIDESVGKTLKVVAMIVSAVLGTGGVPDE